MPSTTPLRDRLAAGAPTTCGAAYSRAGSNPRADVQWPYRDGVGADRDPRALTVHPLRDRIAKARIAEHDAAIRRRTGQEPDRDETPAWVRRMNEHTKVFLEAPQR